MSTRNKLWKITIYRVDGNLSTFYCAGCYDIEQVLDYYKGANYNYHSIRMVSEIIDIVQ